MLLVIDHVSTYATDFAATRRFYEAALGALGSRVQTEFVATWNAEFPTQRICAFCPARAVFWVIEVRQPSSPRHIAFAAASREAVRRFHAAGLTAGGKDNGAPGPRQVYHPDYYAAYLLDPDGNNVEAVCRNPET